MMHGQKNIVLIVRLLLLRYNYMFRPSMLAIFRLYMLFMYNLKIYIITI